MLTLVTNIDSVEK